MKLCSDLRRESGSVEDKWQEIGHKLELSPEALRVIAQKNKTPRQRFYATISAWLHRKGVQQVTLRVLAGALESSSVGEGRLAKVLKGKEDLTKTTSVIVTSRSDAKGTYPNYSAKY
jgi:hypothetical protein